MESPQAHSSRFRHQFYDPGLRPLPRPAQALPPGPLLTAIRQPPLPPLPPPPPPPPPYPNPHLPPTRPRPRPALSCPPMTRFWARVRSRVRDVRPDSESMTRNARLVVDDSVRWGPGGGGTTRQTFGLGVRARLSAESGACRPPPPPTSHPPLRPRPEKIASSSLSA